MAIVIGLSLAAGAIFLFWLFIHAKNGTTAPGQTGGLFGSLEKYIGIGDSLAHNITSFGATIADSAIGITQDSVNTSAKELSKVVNVGGTLLTKGNQIGAQIATTTGGVIKGSITAPFAVAAPIGNGVKDAAKGVYNAGAKVTNTIGSAAGSVVSTIGGWF